MVFPVVMYRCELDHKEIWALKNWCFQTVVLKKTLESPLDSKEIKSVNPKGNEPWVFIRRTVAEAEAPIFGHLMQRANSLEKTQMLGKIVSLTQWTWIWENSRGQRIHEVTKSWTWLSKWSVISLTILNRNWKWHQARE